MTLSHEARRDSRASLRIAALVATHNRPDLLAERSLASIARQVRRPDYLVIVDDSDLAIRRTNERVAADFVNGDTKVVYLENHRTPGASGAWNTGLAWLMTDAPDCFVAVLDDDDVWGPNYLAVCERAAIERDLDMVAAGLLYHDSEEDSVVELPIA